VRTSKPNTAQHPTLVQQEFSHWLGDRVVPVVVDDTRASAVKDALQVYVKPGAGTIKGSLAREDRRGWALVQAAPLLTCRRSSALASCHPLPTAPCQDFRGFARPGAKPKVLIMSYTTFRMHKVEVGKLGIDVCMCDEAHQLKNTDAQITQAVAGLVTKRRLLISGGVAGWSASPPRFVPASTYGPCRHCRRRLSLLALILIEDLHPACCRGTGPYVGTPIQNDLSEFHAIFEIACPGLLGDANDFRRKVGSMLGDSRPCMLLHRWATPHPVRVPFDSCCQFGQRLAPVPPV
jgi:hypothetical protein